MGSRAQLAVLLALLAAILLSAFPYFERIRSANELPRLVQVMSLVEQRSFAVDTPSRRGLALGPDLARSPSGRVYPNKPPGASLAALPAYPLAQLGDGPPTLRRLTWWARLCTGVLPVLLLAAVAWGRLRPRYGSLVASTAVGLGVLATPLFSYARLFYGHALAACLLYLGVVALLRGRASDRTRELALGGLLAAAAITVEYGAAFAGVPIAAALLAPLLRPGLSSAQRRRGARQLGIALAGALVPVLALASYHWAAFGSPWATGYHHAADPGFAELHGQGLLGLGWPRGDKLVTDLLSPSTGLLVWSPICLFGLAGLIRLARQRGDWAGAARLQLGVFAVILLVGLGLSFAGGWRVGPRYLVVALPMLLLGFAEFVAHWRDHPRTGVAAVLLGLFAAAACWSLIANALAATLWPHLDPTNIREPFGAVLIPLWRGGFGPYGLPELLASGTTLCLLLPVFAGLGAVLWASAGVRPRVIVLPALLGAASAALLLLVVFPRSLVAHPKSERNLSYIQSVYEPRRLGPGRASPAPSRSLEPLEDL